MNNLETLEKLYERKGQLFDEIGKVIIGQKDIINRMFVSLLCRGHVLLEGVPGLAKTLLIRTLADVMDLRFNRIQFTPDLMPSDITGTELIDATESGRKFKFFRGPIFANIVLADEINRTPPKTQAALLEAMQEHRVTVSGNSYILDEPFFVLATQNPIEQEGTYPLPEAQLDRFMFNLMIDYPTKEEEMEISKGAASNFAPDLSHVITADELQEFQTFVRNIPVADNVVEYAVDVVGRTRPKDPRAPQFVRDWIDWGAGPRASTYLILAAKANAVLDNRSTPDIADLQAMVKPVLRHRIITNFTAEADGIDKNTVLDKLIKE